MLNINDYAHCITNGATSCNENGRKFEIISTTREERQNLKIVKVDGCMFIDSDAITRCDYIFMYDQIFSCFVELKGTDINHAVIQLKSSLQNISVNGKKYAFVVASKNDLPDAKTQKQKWQKMFKIEYNTTFDMKNNLMLKHVDNLK